MSEPDKSDLEERIARLETIVEALRANAVRQQRGPAAPSLLPRKKASREGDPGRKPSSKSVSETPGSKERDAQTLAGTSERWLGRVGIGFVILAIAFLLKLSFDRGWVTPALRLTAGFGSAAVLLFAGLRLAPTRRILSQALLGGSISIFYLAGWAGFEIYQLLPFWVALSLMTATTVLSISLSDPQDSALLAVIGVSGGLATPFLLDTGSGSVLALSVYISVVLLGGGVVQVRRGWMTLLATLLLGGAIVLSLVAVGSDNVSLVIPSIAIAVYWLVVVASPIVRPVITTVATGEKSKDAGLGDIRTAAILGTGATVILLSAIHGLEPNEIGLLLFLFALITGAIAYWTRRVSISQWPSAEVSALCIALGFWYITRDSTSLLLISIETLVLLSITARGAPASLSTIGHLLAATVALGFLNFAPDAALGGLLGFREGAFLRLGVLGIFVLSSLSVQKDAATAYRSAAYIGLLVWFWSELDPRTYGTQLVSIAWGLQGAISLIASLRVQARMPQLAGLATLGLVAGKLLLFDLSQLDPVWRILMFLGFGAGLLGLAYLVNRPRKEAQPG